MTAEQLEGLLEKVTQGEWATQQTVIHGKSYGGLWVECKDPDQLICLSGSGGAKSYTRCIVGTQDHDDSDANAALIALAPSLARRVICAEKLVEALDNLRELVTQDIGKQLEAEAELDATLTAYREASK